MNKNVCFFSQYYPNLGGVESYTFNLSKLLLKSGYRVTIVTSNIYHLSAHEVIDGIEIFRVPCYNVLEGRYPVLKANGEFRKINRILKKRHFDLVVINTRFYIHSLYGARFAKKNSIKSIIIDHGTSHMTVQNPIFDRIGALWEHFLTFLLKRYCKNFYGVSYACLEWLKHFHIKGQGVLYNSVDTERINEIYKATEISYRREYNLPHDAVIISYTGRLVIEKGIINLIEAVNSIKDKYPIYLFIAGDGPLTEEVKDLRSDRIIPLGRIDFEHIVSLLKESYMYCLPTVYPEGLPTSVLEAIVCKTFVITTVFGGAKEIISDKSFGCIMEDNNVADLSQNIKRIIEDPGYRDKAVENCYNKFLRGYTWEDTFNKLIDLI